MELEKFAIAYSAPVMMLLYFLLLSRRKTVVSGLETITILIDVVWEWISLTFILPFVCSFPVLFSFETGLWHILQSPSRGFNRTV